LSDLSTSLKLLFLARDPSLHIVEIIPINSQKIMDTMEILFTLSDPLLALIQIIVSALELLVCFIDLSIEFLGISRLFGLHLLPQTLSHLAFGFLNAM